MQEGKKYLWFQALEHLIRPQCFLSPQTPTQGGGVSVAGSRGYPLAFPITPVLCTAPSEAKGEGAVGRDEPFLLHKARQPAALGL